MADNTANVYTKEQADSAFAPKSHTHSNYISASSLMTTIFSGFFANRTHFTCYIPGPILFDDWKGLVLLLERYKCTSISTSLGCWGLITNDGGQSYSIIGLHFSAGVIVFDCQGPANTISISHPVQGNNPLTGRYNIGVIRTDRAYNITWVGNNLDIPTSYN